MGGKGMKGHGHEYRWKNPKEGIGCRGVCVSLKSGAHCAEEYISRRILRSKSCFTSRLPWGKERETQRASITTLSKKRLWGNCLQALIRCTAQRTTTHCQGENVSIL